MTSVFRAHGASVSFGGVHAVAGVDLEIESGELVGLIDMGLVLSVCDRVVVLDAGAVIAQGTPAQIRGDERVIAAYLGHASARTAGEA